MDMLVTVHRTQVHRDRSDILGDNVRRTKSHVMRDGDTMDNDFRKREANAIYVALLMQNQTSESRGVVVLVRAGGI